MITQLALQILRLLPHRPTEPAGTLAAHCLQWMGGKQSLAHCPPTEMPLASEAASLGFGKADGHLERSLVHSTPPTNV